METAIEYEQFYRVDLVLGWLQINYLGVIIQYDLLGRAWYCYCIYYKPNKAEINVLFVLKQNKLPSIQIQLNMKNEHLIKYKNPVIIKDEEGKVRMTTYDLPPNQHSYGKKVVDDPEPIKYVVNGWKDAETSGKPPSKLKNFEQLNRQAINNNLHTAKDQSEFRKTRDIMVNVKEGTKVIPIMLPDEQFSYGVPNRPSTPMKLVMGNCYALQAQAKNQAKYSNATQKIQSKTNSKIAAKTTKSQALRQQNAEKQKQYRGKSNLQQKFKLSKFTSLGVTKVDTGLKEAKKA